MTVLRLAMSLMFRYHRHHHHHLYHHEVLEKLLNVCANKHYTWSGLRAVQW